MKGSFNFKDSTWLIHGLGLRGEVRGDHIPVKSQSKHLHGKFTCVSFLLKYQVNSHFPLHAALLHLRLVLMSDEKTF